MKKVGVAPATYCFQIAWGRTENLLARTQAIATNKLGLLAQRQSLVAGATQTRFITFHLDCYGCVFVLDAGLVFFIQAWPWDGALPNDIDRHLHALSMWCVYQYHNKLASACMSRGTSKLANNLQKFRAVGPPFRAARPFEAIYTKQK